MRKTLLFWALMVSLITTAQTDTIGIQSDSLQMQIDSLEILAIQLPDSTAFGTPAGKLVSKEIGPAGGTITSADGKLDLIFPADALTQTTAIQIQPVTTVIPNGNKAYQFEPSGIRFSKPVQLSYHYTDEEAATCPPEFKFMALQDHSGRWEYLAYEDWDGTTNTLKGAISHFSTFVDGNEVVLNPTVV